MSDLVIKGRISEVDTNDKVRDGKRFIFLENGRYSDQVSVPSDLPFKVGDTFESKVKNLSGVSAKTGKPWQFYAQA